MKPIKPIKPIELIQPTKPVASLSLDLDNKWSYMKTHGDPGWESFPSYLHILIPGVLKLLKELDQKITFFIVGQDAALAKNGECLQLITKEGHEVGNHSFHHEPWLHLYSREKIYSEISEAEEQIHIATGQRPNGFRGPGFSWSFDLLDVLHEKKYLYDASSLPTFIGPLARAYYFLKSDVEGEEKEKRAKLFGSLRDGFLPLRPYFWDMDHGKKVMEIPVTTMPFFKMPFHLSYLIYLHCLSPLLFSTYLKTALLLCRISNVQPSFLLHPLDFLDETQVPELTFFPGMKMGARKKAELFKKVIGSLRKYFQLAPMSRHAQSVAEEARQRVRQLVPKVVNS